MTIHRRYSVYEESECVGYLQFTYQKFGLKKWRLVSICDQKEQEIALFQIRINNIYAHYLKPIKSALLPEELEDSGRHHKWGEEYFLDFNGQFFETREVKEIILTICWQKASTTISVLSCCRIFGLKKQLEVEIGELGPDESYLLYYNCRPLKDEPSLEDYGIKSEDVLYATLPDYLSGGSTSLQMATGGEYVSIHDFEAYVHQMEEKIDIVCQIEIPTTKKKKRYGTGFLIGHYLIMTNEHVARGDLKNGRAKFFYHGADQATIEIGLYPEIVCFSKSPAPNRATVDKLDYAILRLKPSPELTYEQLQRLEKIDLVAQDFFKKAVDALAVQESKPIYSLEEELEIDQKKIGRANIIQHPLLKDKKTGKSHPQPKQIAFRDNKTFDPDPLLLHYPSETAPGSSGSPAIDDEGVLIGLHYSECILIQQKLFKHVIKLCEELGYTLNDEETTHIAFCFTSDDDRLYIYRSGELKGKWSHEKKGKKLFLKDLILSKSVKVKSKQLTLKEYILRFLKNQREEDLSKHFSCNTAILAENIIKDLQHPKNQEDLNAAFAASQSEWKVFHDAKLPTLIKYKWWLSGGAVAILVFGPLAIYWWRKNKD